MRAGGGKQKGASFEREVCVALSRWITNNAQTDVYWRSAMSGGRATVARKGGKLLANQVGDISCIDPIGAQFLEVFVVECKHIKDMELKSAIRGKGKLVEFWRKLEQEARPHAKWGFLVFKQNNWPVLLALHNQVSPSRLMTPVMTFPRLGLNVYLFDDWLTKVKAAEYRCSSSLETYTSQTKTVTPTDSKSSAG